MAFSVARPKSVGLFPVGTPKGVYVHSPSEDYERCCSKTSGVCENNRCHCIKVCPREFHVVPCHMTGSGWRLLQASVVTVRHPWLNCLIPYAI
jgi:hypothetical protein